MATPVIVTSSQYESIKTDTISVPDFISITPSIGGAVILCATKDGGNPFMPNVDLRPAGTGVDLSPIHSELTQIAGSSGGGGIKLYKVSTEDLQHWDASSSKTDLTDVIGTFKASYMSPDGTHMYVADSGNNRLHQFIFGTANDIQTITYDGYIPFPTIGNSVPEGCYITPDGTKFFTGGRINGGSHYQFNLTVPFDILGGYTLTYTDLGTSYCPWFLPGDPYTAYFSDDDGFRAYDLTIPYDLASRGAEYSPVGTLFFSYHTPPKFSPDGLFLLSYSSSFKLDAPYDIWNYTQIGGSSAASQNLISNTALISIDVNTDFFIFEPTTTPLSLDLSCAYVGSEEMALSAHALTNVDFDNIILSATTGNSNTANSVNFSPKTDSLRFMAAYWDNSQFPHTPNSPLIQLTTGQTTGGGSGSMSLTTAYITNRPNTEQYTITANSSDDWGCFSYNIGGLIVDPKKLVSINSVLALNSTVSVTTTEVPSAFLVASANITRCVGTVSPHAFGKCHVIADEFKVRAPRPLRVTRFAFEQIVDESTVDFIGGINDPIIIRDDDFGIASDVNRIQQSDHNVFVCRARFLVQNVSNEPVTFKPYNLINIPNTLGRNCLPPEQSYLSSAVQAYQYVEEVAKGITTSALMEFKQPAVWEDEFTKIGPYRPSDANTDNVKHTAFESVVDNKNTIMLYHVVDLSEYITVYKYEPLTKQYEINKEDTSLGSVSLDHKTGGLHSAPINIYEAVISGREFGFSDDDFTTQVSDYEGENDGATVYWNSRYWLAHADSGIFRILENVDPLGGGSFVNKAVLPYNVDIFVSDSAERVKYNIIIEVDPADTDNFYILTRFVTKGDRAVYEDRVHVFSVYKYNITANTITELSTQLFPVQLAIQYDHPYDGQFIELTNSCFKDGKIHFASEIRAVGQMYFEYVFDTATNIPTVVNKEVGTAAVFNQLDTSYRQTIRQSPAALTNNRFENTFPAEVLVPYSPNTLYTPSIDSAIFEKDGYLIPLVKPFVDKIAAYPVLFPNTPYELQNSFLSFAYDSVLDKIKGFSYVISDVYSDSQTQETQWHNHNLVSRQTNQKIGTGTYATTNLCRYDTGRCFDETTIPANGEVEVSIPVYFMSDGYATTVGALGSLEDSYVCLRDQGELISTYKPARAMFSHRASYAISAKCSITSSAIVLIKPLKEPYVLIKARAEMYAYGKASSFFKCSITARAEIKANPMPEELIQLSWYAEKFGYDELFPVDVANLNNDVHVIPSDIDNFEDAVTNGYAWGDLATRFRIHNNTGDEVTINPQLEIQIDDGSWIKTTFDNDDDQAARPPLYSTNHMKYPDDRDGFLLEAFTSDSGFYIAMVIYGATSTEYLYTWENYQGNRYGRYIVFNRTTQSFTQSFNASGDFQNMRPPFLSTWINTTERLICARGYLPHRYNVSTRAITPLPAALIFPGGLSATACYAIKPVQTSTPSGDTYILTTFRDYLVGNTGYDTYNCFGQFNTGTNTVTLAYVDLSVVGLDKLVARISNIIKHPVYTDRFKIIIINDDATANVYIADLSVGNVVSNLSSLGSAASLGIENLLSGASTPALPGSWQDPDGYVHCGLGNNNDSGSYVIYNPFTDSLIFPNKLNGKVTEIYSSSSMMDWWGEGANHSQFLLIGHYTHWGTQVLTKLNPTDIHYTVDFFDDNNPPWDIQLASRFTWKSRFYAELSDVYATDSMIPYWIESENTFRMLAGYRSSTDTKQARLRTLGIGKVNTHGEDVLQKISLGSNFVTNNHSNIGIWDNTGDVVIPSKSSIEVTVQLGMEREWFDDALTGVNSTEKHWIKVRFVDDSLVPATITQRKGNDYFTIWTLPGLAVAGEARLKAYANVTRCVGTKVTGDPGGGQASLTAVATVSAIPFVPSEIEGYSNFTLDFTIPSTSYIFTKGIGLVPLQTNFTMTNYHTVHRSGKVSIIAKSDVNAFVGIHIPKTCP